jgi:TusE/DsrC/DsvC family sulfur relay protein
MAYELNGTVIEHDDEGYLTDVSVWNRQLAELIAQAENIEMNDDVWEVVNFLRQYYEQYEIAPGARILVKAIKNKLGPDKGNSNHLYGLFPYGPGRQGCKIAGLPKPTSCI